MSKQPYRYRTLKWRYIYLVMGGELLFWWIMTVLAWDTIALFIIPSLALVGGWQMGVLSERNDWQDWYKSAPKSKKPSVAKAKDK